MYTYNNSTCNPNYTDFSYSFSGDLLGDSPVPDSTLSSLSSLQHDSNLMIPNMTEYDSVPALMMKQELCYNYNNNSSSGCSSYGSPSSLTSYETHMERSLSSHSLHKNLNGFNYNPTQFTVSDDSTPVRKAFSTGDLDRVNMVQQHQYYHRSESCLSNESSIIECMNAKACKYTPEEKKERIEKYRSKRNHRNFNKKIKYVCRKTLADSRPRIRGRFAKNSDENEKADQMINEWNRTAADHLEEDDENWINFLDAFSANLIP